MMTEGGERRQKENNKEEQIPVSEETQGLRGPQSQQASK
jgi:hypothetical protein